jgi:iron complex transport system substrate-binding protein
VSRSARAARAILAVMAAALTVSAASSARAGEPVAARSERLDWAGLAWNGPPSARPPRRVVTLAPSLTDLLVAMGLADRIVGVTLPDRAPEVATLPRMGGFVDPNPEAILWLRPDLVLWAYHDKGLIPLQRLAELSRASPRPFPILALPAESVADALAAPRIVGEAMGEAEAGRALQASMTAGVERFRERARRLPRRRVLFVVGREPFVVAGPGSFLDELLHMAGCENVVAQGPRWPVYSLERAVADAPELVIDAALEEPESSVARLAAIPAVRRGSRFALRSDDLLHPGPKMILGLEELLQALQSGAR